MMENNKTIFTYISQVFATFGIILLLFVLFGLTIGDSAKEYSSLFTLGSQGFSTATILQLFLSDILQP